MARKDPQFHFRMPQELKDRLEESAKKNNRTMNAELIARIEDSFKRERGDELQQYFGKMADELGERILQKLGAPAHHYTDVVLFIAGKADEGVHPWDALKEYKKLHPESIIADMAIPRPNNKDTKEEGGQ